MRLKKILGVTLSATMCLGALVGCSNSDTAKENIATEKETQKGAESVSDEKFTLKISTTGEKDDGLDIAMEMYKERYPNVEYEIISSPWSETREKQIMMLSMGDVPDIGKLGGWAQEFYADGLVKNLTEDIKDWEMYDKFTEGQLQRMSYGEDICALNFNTNTMFMFYNKDILSQLGVDVPTTFDDLKALGEKIVAEGTKTADGQKIYATNIPTNNPWELSSWVFSLGAEYMNEDFTQTLINSKESIEAHTLMQEFVKKEWAPVPDGTGDQLWLNGQIATYVTGEWNIPATLDAGINVGYTTMPTSGDYVSSGPIGGCDWAIFEGAEQPEKALEFLELMYSEAFQLRADRGVTDLAIYDNPEKQAVWKENGLLESKMVQQEQLKNAKYAFLDAPYNFPEGANVYNTAVQRILIKQEDVKAVLEDAATQINNGIAANK